MDNLMSYFVERGYRMKAVEEEAEILLQEYKEELEVSKAIIKSNLNEFALEGAGIRLTNIVIWDEGSIDLEFGTMVED